MLNAIRVAAANWLGRAVLTVIMGVLILSFAIWGIGDIFRGGVNRTIATVGSTKISADDLRGTFNSELRRIQMQLRRAVTAAEARSFGLDRELINRKIDEAAMAQEASRLGLALDTPMVLASIMDAAEFKTSGQFDRAKLAEALGQAGLNEKEFLRAQEQHLLRREIQAGLVGGLVAPLPLLQAVHAFRSGTRDIEAILLDPARIAAPPPPEEAAIRDYYEAHRSAFRTVETRKVTLLALGLSNFAAGLDLSAEELKAYYTAALAAGKIGTPERRALQRVLFDSEAEAQAALEQLHAGGDFSALLQARQLAPADVDFGARASGEIADPAQRKAIFAAEAGAAIGPFKDEFGYVLYRIGKIEAADVPGFDAIKGLLDAEARAEKLTRDPAIRAKLEAATKAVEEARLAGKGLAEAARAAGVEPIQIAALDKNGADATGKPLTLPGGPELIGAVFASDIGLDNEPLTMRDGSHLWYEVNTVDPERERALEDVRAEVVRGLAAQARDKALLAQAEALIRRLGAGEPLGRLAQELDLGLEHFKGIKRGQREARLGGSGIDRAFSGPLGQAITALAGDGAQRLVMVPVKAETPPFDAAALEAVGLTRQLAKGMGDDIMAGYIAALRRQLGVSINQALLNQTLGQAN